MIESCEHEVIHTENNHFVYCTKCHEDFFIDEYNWYLARKEQYELHQKIAELEARVKELHDVSNEVRDDLLKRGEIDSDGTRVVNLGSTLWNKFCDTIDK